MMNRTMGAGCKMLLRSIALAAVLFIPTNFAHGPVKVMQVTVIYHDPTPVVWIAPAVRSRSPGPEVWDAPVIAAVIIPRAKPALIKKPKPDAGPRKCWRTQANGHKSYRLRRVCREGERTKP